LRLDDEAVRVAVALRLGLKVCVPHSCHCGQDVDAWGLHASVCKHAPGRIQRHHALNDIIARACASAGVPVSKEPSGLFPGDIRRPDGITLIPWQAGKALAWDPTVTSTLADSYIHQSATTAGAAAELAAARKVSKYDDIPVSFMFQPVALETLGPINDSAIRFVEDLGRRISAISSEAREGVFLFQRLSVLMQRFDAILVRDSFCASDTSDLWSSQ